MTSPAGYDPAFLPALDLAPPSRPGLVERPYNHFTVAIDPERRLAASTAVNIDGSQLREVDGGDDWQLDPRLSAAQQAASGLDGTELNSSDVAFVDNGILRVLTGLRARRAWLSWCLQQ